MYHASYTLCGSVYLLKSRSSSQQLHCLSTVARERQIQRCFAVVVLRCGIRLHNDGRRSLSLSAARTAKGALRLHARRQATCALARKASTLASRRTRMSGGCLFMAAPISGVLPNRLAQK